MAQLPNFNSIEKRVFLKHKGDIYLGQELIKPETLDILREQARYLKTSQLYEVLKATITNESYSSALIQSTDFEQVIFAKALYHWVFVLDNIIENLTKR